MHSWRVLIGFCASCIIYLFVGASSTREKQYKRKSTYDNMSCKQSDIILRENLPNVFGCLAYCTGRRCGTVFYNPGTSDCIGCSSVYINTDEMTLEDGTIAYEFQFECPNGEEKFKTSCYRKIQPTSWILAKITCTSTTNNSHLAVPESEEENSYVASKITGGYDSFILIGICDMEAEGTFLTVQGNEVVFTNWHTGEPNNYYHDEDCVIANYYGTWYDARCYEVHEALCESGMLLI